MLSSGADIDAARGRRRKSVPNVDLYIDFQSIVRDLSVEILVRVRLKKRWLAFFSCFFYRLTVAHPSYYARLL